MKYSQTLIPVDNSAKLEKYNSNFYCSSKSNETIPSLWEFLHFVRVMCFCAILQLKFRVTLLKNRIFNVDYVIKTYKISGIRFTKKDIAEEYGIPDSTVAIV